MSDIQWVTHRSPKNWVASHIPRNFKSDIKMVFRIKRNEKGKNKNNKKRKIPKRKIKNNWKTGNNNLIKIFWIFNFYFFIN